MSDQPTVVSARSKGPLERAKGIIKFFDRERNYGFCKRQGALDVFFHGNSLTRAGIDVASIKQGDVLEFDLVPVPGKGGKAINIRMAGADNNIAAPS